MASEVATTETGCSMNTKDQNRGVFLATPGSCRVYVQQSNRLLLSPGF
jgi:hypothetical protein